MAMLNNQRVLLYSESSGWYTVDRSDTRRQPSTAKLQHVEIPICSPCLPANSPSFGNIPPSNSIWINFDKFTHLKSSTIKGDDFPSPWFQWGKISMNWSIFMNIRELIKISKLSSQHPPSISILVVGIPTPLKNMSSSIGTMIIPNMFGKVTVMFQNPLTKSIEVMNTKISQYFWENKNYQPMILTL